MYIYIYIEKLIGQGRGTEGLWMNMKYLPKGTP